MTRYIIALEVEVSKEVDIKDLVEDICKESQAFIDVEVVDTEELK